MIPGAGHILQLEKSDECNQAMLKQLAMIRAEL